MILLVAVAAVALVAWAVVRAAPGRSPGLRDDLDRWVAAGLLTREQADAVLAYEHAIDAGPVSPDRPKGAVSGRAVAARTSRIPAAAEALGYLGGVLAATGVTLLVARAWDDLGLAGRLALSGAAAAALCGAGAAVREDADPALARLRWFLWLVSTAATGLFTGVVVRSGFGVERAVSVAAAVAAAVALQSGVLWGRRNRPLQQLAFLGGVAVLAGAAVAHTDEQVLAGSAVWLTGAVYVLLGLRRRTPAPLLTEAAGGATLFFGSALATSGWEHLGLPLGLLAALALLALATVPGLAPTRGDVTTAAVTGGVCLVWFGPGTVGYFARDAGLLVGLLLWSGGAALALAAIRRLLRAPLVLEAVGAAAVLGGAALTAVQVPSFAPLFGLASAVGLVAAGTLPGRILLSLAGCLGLLVNVPWTIGRFFPGENRMPVLVLASGAVILAVAVVLARAGGRVRVELRGPRRGGPRPQGPRPA